MSKLVKRNAIHSGIGDNDDLFVKQPSQEDTTEEFQYAARLRGKKRHDTMIYPELPFQYGVSYKGETLETYNEKEYEFDINAHPEKVINYGIEETKELPVKRLWETQACFEAEVLRHNLKYAVTYKAHEGVVDQRTAEYAVNWAGLATIADLGDLKSYCTSATGDALGDNGYGNWIKQSSFIEDKTNTSKWSGVIAKDAKYKEMDSYAITYKFKPQKALGEAAGRAMRKSSGGFYNDPGWDDDCIGFIFKAKDKNNFYMMLWEAEEQLWMGSRPPDKLDGLKIVAGSGTDFIEQAVAEHSYLSGTSTPTNAQWTNYLYNVGWGKQHRRIYRVKNGVLTRVDVTPSGRSGGTNGFDSGCKDLGSGRGWKMETLQGVKVDSAGRNVSVSVQESTTGSWQEVFNFEAEWDTGSFGVINVSQAVEFHQVSVVEKRQLAGRIPASGWNSTKEDSLTVASNAATYVRASPSFASQLKAQGVTASSVGLVRIAGDLRSDSNGTITVNGLTGSIIVKANDFTTRVDYTGRIPKTGWYEFDGVGEYQLTSNARDFIRQKSGNPDLIISEFAGIVQDPKAGSVVKSALTGPIIAKNNNAADAGQKYDKCYIQCEVVEVTPDNRNYKTGLLVWSDIATAFKEDYAEFFNRADYINKKAEYQLLQPIKKDPPKPPPVQESQAGCVVEEPTTPEEDEINQCLNDFDFDGKKLIMWSCEFPVEVALKHFDDKVFAYQGKVTFNPLAKFISNKWTKYKLIPTAATLNPLFDEIKWAGREDNDNAPPGTKVTIQTKEWYKAIFGDDAKNKGLITSDGDLTSDIPPAPEHFWLPTKMNDPDIINRMPDHFEVIHYLLDAWKNDPDVVIYFKSKPTLTTENADRRSESLAAEGKAGMPILLTTNDIDTVVVHCKEYPRYSPWSSGKYIGYGKLNGKRPFWGNGAGKADMTNVSTEVVYFPENLVKESLSEPFIDIYDDEFPNYPRVEYKLHSDNTRLDFWSDYTDAYIWYSDWYSNWIENEKVFTSTMRKPTQIETPLDLDPTNPLVSSDYNPDNTTIERIEVTSNNPFVKLWIEEDKGRKTGLIGTYYRFPLTSNVYEEKFQVVGDYKEWTQGYQIESYMNKVEIEIQHESVTVNEVYIEGVLIMKGNTNGWRVEGQMLILNGTAIKEGMLQIRYSTGTVDNLFMLTENLGAYIEVYVGGRLLDPVDYSFDKRLMTINKEQLYLNDWVHIQSYELNDLHDPTKKNYLGEYQYSQLDFQEDVPSSPTNPNYDDANYEGSFCFNWGFGSPKGMQVSPVEPAAYDFNSMSMYLPEDVQFKFNVDMEIVYPVGAPIDISNFTGEWKQWDVDPIKVFNASGVQIDGPGDWHGPPEAGYPEVTNLLNQSYHSGWYNPAHKDLTDYEFKFKVQARNGDDDMYGAIFKFDPITQNFYSFEWDGYWGLTPPNYGTGVRGMAIYKNTCTNPASAGIAKLTYTRTQLAHADISWTPHQSEIHEIKVSTIGNKIKVWTDSILRFEIEDDNNPFLKGSWGPVTQSQPKTYFWDFWMQIYHRITPVQEASFRMLHEFSKTRPMIDIDPMIEIEVDSSAMEDKFLSILESYCLEKNIDKSSVLSKEYYLGSDTSEHTVYFKELPEITQLKETKDGKSKLYSTVKGQYKPAGIPVENLIAFPEEPSIPDLEPPIETNPNEGFTASWNGYIYAPESGVYKFKATANDGFRLWVRNTEMITEWHVTGDPNYFPEYEASIYLEGNTWHPIRANFFDNVGQALVRLHWAQPGKGFKRISPDYLTPYLGYKLFAQVKQATPLPWNPLIHSGYYYHEEQENYLYADKAHHKKTPNLFHEVSITPRPQQGSAIIVRDNEGKNLRKVTFYDEDWNLTLENKEAFSGNGYAKYYLSYKDIDQATLKVKLNGSFLLNSDFIFNKEESSIEFMEELSLNDKIEASYILLYSYYLDINADVVDGFVNKDMATIRLHSNYIKSKMANMEIIYEAAKETPFYRTNEVVFNPLLNHNHTGFLYITKNHEQDVKEVMVNLSENTLSASGKEKVLLTAKVTDKYNNPIPNKVVKMCRDDILIDKEFVTNHAGEVFLYDQPTPKENMISVYQVKCEGITRETLLNYYLDNESERFYLDIMTPKLAIMAGLNDEATILVTLRDENWDTTGAGKAIKVEYRDTYGATRLENVTTNAFGQVSIKVSGQNEQHGNLMVKVSYDMGFEETANYVHLKVIGG